MGAGERRGGPGRRNRRRNNNIGGNHHGNRGTHWRFGHTRTGRAARFGTMQGSISMMATGGMFCLFSFVYSFIFFAFWSLAFLAVGIFFIIFGGLSFYVYKKTNGQVEAGSSVSVISVAASHMSTTTQYNHTSHTHQDSALGSTMQELMQLQGYNNEGYPQGQASYPPPPGGPNSAPYNPKGQGYPPQPPPGGHPGEYNPYNQQQPPSSSNPSYPPMFAYPGAAQNVNPGYGHNPAPPASAPPASAPWPNTATTSNGFDPNPPDYNQPPPPGGGLDGSKEPPPPSYDNVVGGNY